MPRRTSPAGSALAAVASAGCLQDADRTDGNGDGAGEPTTAVTEDLLVSTHDPDGNCVYAVRALTGAGAVRQAFEVNEGGGDTDGPVDQVDFEFARVSLTVDADRRVNFNPTEGVVQVDDGA